VSEPIRAVCLCPCGCCEVTVISQPICGFCRDGLHSEPGPSPLPSAREGEKHRAGAERPKVESTVDAPGSPDSENQVRQHAAEAANCVNTKILSLSLRERAQMYGLKPGSARWRAYVLGTQSAARKRGREKRQKRNRSENGLVTPGK
jgi:hypothetical protein